MQKVFLSGVCAVVLLGGCSVKNNELVVHQERSKEFLEDSEKYTIADKINEHRIAKEYVWIYPNMKLSSALKELGKLQNKYYYLQGRDFEITGTQAFKVHDFNELNDYVKTLTNYEVEITKNLLHATLPKIVEIKEQKKATILDNIQFNSALYNVPAHQFSELTRITDGWRVIDEADIKADFNSKQYVNFRGSLREFLEYYAKNNNIFVDLNYNNKEIVFKKFKTKHFPLSITTAKYEFNNEIQTGIDDENEKIGTKSSSSSSSSGKETGKMTVKSSYDMLTTLTGLMKKIIDDKNPDEYWSFFDSTNELIVKTSPEKMQTVENIVHNINQTALKQVYMKVTIYEVTLDKKFQAGIDWGYLNNVTDSSGNLIRVTAANSSGTMATIDGTLASPSVFKYAGEGLNVGLTALNQFGDANILEQAPMMTTNNIPAVHSLIDRETFISDYSTTSTASVGSESSVEQSKAVGGSYIYVKPTVFQDKIFMELRLVRATVDDILKQNFGTSGQFVQSPQDSRNILTQNITVNSGERIVIGGLIKKKNKRSYKGMSPDGNSVLATLTGINGQDYLNKEIVIVIEAKEM